MGNCIIAMESSTFAEKGVRVLRNGGISCERVSIDPTLTRKGCGFGISLPRGAADRATELLGRKNIPYGELLGGV